MLRFAVMGDVHYVQPESHKEAFGGKPNGITELEDLRRNLWMTENVLPEVISGISALGPQFVIQTGDLIQGHCDDDKGALREMKEALNLINGLNVPVFFAPGTHDGIPGRPGEITALQLLYPSNSKSLGKHIDKGYFSFVKENSLFVILDYTTFNDNDNQAEFIKNTLEKSVEFQHVFVFAHPPIIPVGRPFFSIYEFSSILLETISKHSIDVYFCSHTHNQVASIHKVGDKWLPHLKSTVLGYPDIEPVALADVRPLLPEKSTFELGWGFLEDTAPGWWLVTVDGEYVKADWYFLHKGLAGCIEWKSGERPQFTKLPDLNINKGKLPTTEDILSVRLRAAGVGCLQKNACAVYLNNTFIGHLPALEYFDCRQFLQIGKAEWSLLKEKNLVRVTTSHEPMCIGGFVLEIETKSGWVRSSVSDFHTNSHNWDRWNAIPVHHIPSGSEVEVELLLDARYLR